MSKTKSITDLVTDLQQENESLKNLSRLANQYTRQEFGFSVRELHEIIENMKNTDRIPRTTLGQAGRIGTDYF